VMVCDTDSIPRSRTGSGNRLSYLADSG
jgi:hypothetical protein